MSSAPVHQGPPRGGRTADELDPQYEQKRRDLSRKGKLAVLIGGTVAFLGGITFALFFFVALYGDSMLFSDHERRQGLVALGFAAFLYFLGIVMMVGGGLVAVIGGAVLLFANTGRMMRFQAAGAMPVAREVARQVSEMRDDAHRGALPAAPPPAAPMPGTAAPLPASAQQPPGPGGAPPPAARG